jgi:hypothetical protein
VQQKIIEGWHRISSRSLHDRRQGPFSEKKAERVIILDTTPFQSNAAQDNRDQKDCQKIDALPFHKQAYL